MVVIVVVVVVVVVASIKPITRLVGLWSWSCDDYNEKINLSSLLSPTRRRQTRYDGGGRDDDEDGPTTLHCQHEGSRAVCEEANGRTLRPRTATLVSFVFVWPAPLRPLWSTQHLCNSNLASGDEKS